MSSNITMRDVTRDVVADLKPSPSLLVINHERQSCIGLLRPVERAPMQFGRELSTLGPGVLTENRLSRRHAVMTRQGDRVFLQDLGSTNGTTVDGRDIRDVGAPVEVLPGQIISFGDLMIMLTITPPGFVPPTHDRLIGISAALAEVLDEIHRVAPHDTTVLVQGETGCGKELIARELHERSGRKGPLVPVHCGGIGDALLLSELFGHIRGAFTGADRDRPGLVASAEGGTLFLDEIGEASPALQVAMLRLLQEGEYRPVGSTTTRKADVRVVAATHRDLSAMVDAGTFREDLMARLARWVIEIAPLRERREDIPLLALHLANRHAQKPVKLHRNLVAELLRHRWSKNVRELDSWMERAVVNSNGESTVRLQAWMTERIEAEAAQRIHERPARPAPQRPPSPRPDAEGLVQVIREHNGIIKAAARALGVSRNTFYRWCEDYEIDPQAVRREL